MDPTETAGTTDLLRRWRAVRERIDDAAARAGRDPSQVLLVAVSKFHPEASISALAAAGQLDFGENYVQDALSKQEGLQGRGIRWHFIGRMQSNKAKALAGNFHLIHSLDNLKMARRLHNHAEKKATPQPVLLQVNVAAEETKAGADPRELASLAAEVESMDWLELQGLMCMPPIQEDGEHSRPYFVRLRQLKEQVEQNLARGLIHLSMGMSTDFTQAVEEGATLVRIGTGVFGPRPAG
jgi:hypothetical protein